jgi:hypothetical protein
MSFVVTASYVFKNRERQPKPQGVFMKIVSFLATAMFAASAFATTTVYHDYDAALRGIALDNACITDTEVRTIKPVKHCTELVPVEHNNGGQEGGSWTDWVCNKYEVATLAYPRAFERVVCTNYQSGHGEEYGGCVQTGVVQDFLPATIKVSVVTENGEYSNYPGVSHMHTFPACK